MKKKVLIMADYYVPSIKGGGPIRSIKNLVDHLSDRIDFYIITNDRDLGNEQPFENIKTDEWLQVGKARVFYTNLSKLTWRKMFYLVAEVNYDVLYLNSFFSYKVSILPIMLNKIKKIPRTPIVMAPRGQFSPGALGLKSKRKRLYLKVAKGLGLYRNVTWHATTDIEKKDIEKVIGNTGTFKVSNNLTANYGELDYHKNILKKKGELKVVFISRVHPKKNLKKAIEFLKNVDGKIEFNIYGPLEDKPYWTECQNSIESLPENIKVSFNGVLDHDNIIDVFKVHHVFLFPTLGENFGHVISEAFIGGCPVIISDQTPWRGLEEYQVGWDIPLTEEEKFEEVLNYCVKMDNAHYKAFSERSFLYGKELSNKSCDKSDAYGVFDID
ncbi:glycosyltransferase family 4 protein [Halobacillus amylolyticus]|uniref:Glycosyltransferase family 4 protein n=1 Tax=Halobacillus amylolyticus TaxID=2932259 RepID=A0ABY4H9N8_9BACI|nr:glycosyltransferase family 4 protein [Halobacillus amylolyticus]UOR11314.1 glycosyltransferase family 4 protein [Halobacillus amylolyticus]